MESSGGLRGAFDLLSVLVGAGQEIVSQPIMRWRRAMVSQAIVV